MIMTTRIPLTIFDIMHIHDQNKNGKIILTLIQNDKGYNYDFDDHDHGVDAKQSWL